MRFLLFAFGLMSASAAFAETVVANRTIRPQEIITAQDVRLDRAKTAGAHDMLEQVIGQEARLALYPGRAVMRGQVGEPALVDRNQLVEIVFTHGGLRIVTEGRALGRGSAGERIRVMNLSSRSVLFGMITETGSIEVRK